MDIWQILMTPFTWLLKFFYGLFGSYGMALIVFTLVVKVLLFPLSLKGKKSMIQTTMLQGQVQKLQKQYGKDQARYNAEVQKLYEKEGVNPTGGCLWSMLPLAILFPLYAIIRRPLKYWLGLSESVIPAVMEAAAGAGVATGSAYGEIAVAAAFLKDPAVLSAAQAVAGDKVLYGIDFSFLGIDLAATPTPMFWKNGFGWDSIGLILIPVLCVVTSFLSTKIMMKTNEINNQAQQSQQNNLMTWMSPLMMLWFSFIMPAGMGIYMIANSVFSVVQEILCGRILKKDYEAAAERRRQQELEEKEEEKRLRREKAEQKARELEEAKKNKGKKKEKAEDDGSKMTPEQREASRVGIRQYARGRAYDPDRFGGVTPYHEDLNALASAGESADDGENRQDGE